MARGGYRPGAGRPKASSSEDGPVVPVDPLPDMTPLEYMLAVMLGKIVGSDRQDKMAVAAAPYCHGRAADADAGKKATRADNAKTAASGKYATPAPPRMVVNNEK